MTTTLLSVRVNSLICVGKLLDYMDKWQVIDDVLPWMSSVPSKEPGVIMAIVGIYKLAVSSSKLGLTKEEMANKALPFLIPLSIENGLTVQQFNIIVSLVREMMTKIETEHRTKLEQLNSIQDSQKSSLRTSLSENMTLPADQLVAAPSPQEVSRRLETDWCLLSALTVITRVCRFPRWTTCLLGWDSATSSIKTKLLWSTP